MPSHSSLARIVLAVVSAAALCGFALGQCGTHLRADETDAWLFAYYGDRLLAGATLYSDVWDNKPPGIYWVNAAALALSGGHYGGVVVASVLATLVTVAGIGRAVRALSGSGGVVLATLLAAVSVGLPEFRAGSNRPETWVMMLATLSLLSYLAALDHPRRRWWVLAGACGVAAVMFKQTGGAALLAMGVHQLWRAWQSPPMRQPAVHALWWGTVGGAGTLLLVALGVGLTADVGWAWHAVVTFNGSYMAGGAISSLPVTLSRFIEHHAALSGPLILAGAVLLCVAGVRLSGSPGASNTPRVGVVVLWFAFELVMVAASPGHALHYFAVLLPPLLILAGVGVTAIDRQLRPTGEPTVASWALLVWLAYVSVPAVRQQGLVCATAWRVRTEEPDPFQVADAVALVERFAQPSDSIFVWGYAPRVYWETRRWCPSRFTGLDKVGQLPEHTQFILDALLASFQSDPPRVIVVRADAITELAAAPPGTPLDWRPLARFIQQNYRPVGPLGMVRREDDRPDPGEG